MAEEVERVRKSVTDLGQMLTILDSQAMGATKRFGEFADTGNKAWTMMSRFLSGTGLWALQNHIRAVGNAIKLMNDAQLKKIKADIEEVEGMSQLNLAFESQQKQIETINKLREDENWRPTLVEGMEEEYEAQMKIVNEYRMFKSILDESSQSANAHALAIEKTQGAYQMMGEEIKKVRQKRIDSFNKALDKQNKKEEILAQQEIIREAKKSKAQLKAHKKRIKVWLKEKEKQAEKLEDIERRIKNNEFATHKTRSALMSERVKAQMKLEKAQGAIDDSSMKITEGIDNARESADRMSGAKQRLKELTGLKAQLKGVGKILSDSGLGKLYLWHTENKGFWKKTGNIWDKIKEGSKSSWKVAKFAARNLMFFTLLLMGAFLVFSIIRKIFENAEIMTTIIEGIKGLFEGVAIAFSALQDIFMAFFGTGTFGERLQLLLKGILKMWAGLGKILMTSLAWAIKGIGGLLFGIVEFVFVNIPQMLFAAGMMLGNLITKLVSGTWKGTKKWFIERWEDFKTWVTNSAIWKAIVWIGKKFTAGINKIITGLNYIPGVDIPKLAKGGIISSGGMALVGERGPELVNLPRGAEVHSNANSRKMMGNTINVNVSGRVGASDSELRDIAKKIGRMVSAEINRTTSSSTNVRF